MATLQIPSLRQYPRAFSKLLQKAIWRLMRVRPGPRFWAYLARFETRTNPNARPERTRALRIVAVDVRRLDSIRFPRRAESANEHPVPEFCKQFLTFSL